MQPYALVVGESLVDVVTTADGLSVERAGGSAATVAVALARLGRPVRFATAYGDDERGRLLAEHLAGSGVEMATDPHVLAGTSSAEARIAADGAASYVFDLDWRLGPLGQEQPAFLHVCSLGAVVTPGADDVLRLLERMPGGATVTYDVNVRPAVTGTGPDLVARVESVTRHADLVKASDEDLAALYPLLGVDAAAAHLRSLGARVVVVTRGGDGATWYGEEGALSAPAASATPVDTIGAGDTFAAAIIDALWDDLRRDPAEVLAHAARAAAVTVSRPGADPPTRADLSRE